jgi:hypothetical protein
MRRCGTVNPEDIDAYIQSGVYALENGHIHDRDRRGAGEDRRDAGPEPTGLKHRP